MSAVAQQSPDAHPEGAYITHQNDQLQFPSVYESVYKARQMPLRMYPSAYHPPMDLYVGTDFQSHVHADRRAEAHQMVRAKVEATRNMRHRAMTSHQGYYGMPEPVLSQRKFANPSNGAYSAYSARQDYSSAPFHYADAMGGMTGGVLRTRQGQMHGKQRLMDRIGQLNRIEAAKQSLLGVAPMGAPTGLPTRRAPREVVPVEEGETPLIELYLLLQSVLDAVMEGNAASDIQAISQFSFKETTRALELLFRLAPSLDVEELTQLHNNIAALVGNLDGFLDEDRIASEQFIQVPMSLHILFSKALEYVKEMMSPRAMAMSDVNRRLLSRNLVRTLQFGRIFRDAQDLQKMAILAPTTENIELAEDRDDGPNDGEFSAAPGAVNTASARYTREDAEAEERPAAQFSTSERQVFGYNSGAYYGEPISDEGDRAFDRRVEPTEGTEVAEVPAIRVEEVPDLSSRFDPDTQAFNVDAGAPRRRTIGELRAERRAERVAEAAPAAPAAPAFNVPRSRDDLPRTKEDYDRLAKYINSLPSKDRPTTDKLPIQVYSGSQLKSIRANFIKRLGL